MCGSMVDIQSPTAENRRGKKKLECGPMPNVMTALSNIGGALCSTTQRRKVWLMPTAGVSCSNAAKTRNPLKLAGMPGAPNYRIDLSR